MISRRHFVAGIAGLDAASRAQVGPPKAATSEGFTDVVCLDIRAAGAMIHYGLKCRNQGGNYHGYVHCLREGIPIRA